MDISEVKIPDKTEMLLVSVDHYLENFEILELNDNSQKNTIVACNKMFSRHGIPSLVILFKFIIKTNGIFYRILPASITLDEIEKQI